MDISEIKNLKIGNRVKFGNKVIKTVTDNHKRTTGSGEVYFSAFVVSYDDEIWKIAELQKPELKDIHPLASFSYGYYEIYGHPANYTPGEFLGLLKSAVTTLEAAGVKVYDN